MMRFVSFPIQFCRATVPLQQPLTLFYLFPVPCTFLPMNQKNAWKNATHGRCMLRSHTQNRNSRVKPWNSVNGQSILAIYPTFNIKRQLHKVAFTQVRGLVSSRLSSLKTGCWHVFGHYNSRMIVAGTRVRARLGAR